MPASESKTGHLRAAARRAAPDAVPISDGGSGDLLPVLALGLLAAIPYLQLVGAGFVWDDLLQIAGNPLVREPTAALAYLHRLEGIYYRPAVFLSYALEHLAWGDAAAAYHVTNVVLHALTAMLLAATARRTGLSLRASLVGGAVFAFHPIQSEAVAYISGRTDLLATAAALLAWWFAWGRGSALRRGLLCAPAAVVGVLSKESGYAVMLLLPWVAWRRESGWKGRAALAGPTLLAAAALLLLRPGSVPAAAVPNLSRWVLGIGATLQTYARLLLWPATLMVDRLTPVGGSAASDMVSLALLVLVVGLVAWGLRRSGPVADWTAWALAFYLPVANLVPIYPAIASRAVFTPEHNLYASLAGIGMLLAIGADRVMARLSPGRRAALAAVGCAVLLLWGIRTAVRTADWRDEVRLFGSAARAGSLSPRVWYDLGNVLLRRQRFPDAVAALHHAAELSPDDPQIWANLGVALQRQGRLDAAAQAYERARTVGPPSAQLWENIGSLELARGHLAAARDALARALAIDPQRQRAQTALRAVERAMGTPSQRPPP